MKSSRLFFSLVACSLLLPMGALHATQTENSVLRIVPAPGTVKVDGKADDWDLSGGIFACDDVERLRDLFSVWFFAMYDKDNLYLLAKWKDPTPLNNDQSGKGGHGFSGDCLQVRVIAGYQTPTERVSHWMGWLDRDKTSILGAAYNRDFRGPGLDNALAQGAQQAFQVDADGKGYVQEIAIPWKLLTADGQAPAPGSSLRMAVEPNFSAGPPWGRINIHDIFREGVTLDRVFTFRAYDQWGEGAIEKSGHLAPAPVRLADERTFPVRLAAGSPEADWAGLIQKHELTGFKTIRFDVPADGAVSLNIRDAEGTTARQLLTENSFEKGAHEVKWDGLTTPHYKTPGEPAAPGTYTWDGIAHPPFRLTLRGWAASSGSTPWENGATSNWGGDHGKPDALATDGGKIYLGWGEAEAGKGILGCDPDGNVVWKVGTGLGFSSQALAVDGGILFSLGREDIFDRREIVRLRASDGVFDNWEGHPSAALDIPELWDGQPDKGARPQAADGMDAAKGRLYLSFSSQALYPPDIVDWKGFAVRLVDGKPLDQRILGLIGASAASQLQAFVDGKATEKQLLQGHVDVEAAKALNSLLPADDLVAGADKMPPLARAEANRRFLEAQFPSCLAPLATNFIAVCDAHSGKLLKTVPARYPQALRVLGDGRVAYVSDGSSIEAVDPDSGSVKPLVTGLRDATGLTSDASGRIYVAVAGAGQQVKIFTPDGRPAGAIGRAGGRRLLGKWQPDGLYAPSAVAVDDANKRLWVAEDDFFPKRISVWNLADGTLVKELLGPTHYGASGGAIDPLDPNVMVGLGCEWRLDPATGRSVCTGVFSRSISGFAAFCPASNGRLYLATLFEVMHNASGLRIYERTGEGEYKPCAEWRPDYGTQTTTVWSDVNGDGKEDPGEVTVLPYAIQLHGSNSWSANLNRADFTLFGGVYSARSAQGLAAYALRAPAAKMTQAVFDKVYRINPDGFTPCGAPKWDLARMEELPYVWSPALAAGGFGMVPSPDNRLLLTVENDDFRCYDLEKKRVAWSYPNPFYQVHGSHQAPPPTPGVTRGAYGAVGTFRTPKLGTVWVVNGNCGEWYLLTEQGYYLGHLFQGDVMKMHYPDKAVPGADMSESPSGSGGEDFGGSVTQAPDGKVYVEAGKTAYWNLLLTGLDQVAAIGDGKVEIKPDDLALARAEQEAQMQAAAGSKLADIKRLTPAFTGSPAKDFAGIEPVSFQKGEGAAVSAVQAWDDQALYLGWSVTDNTPWTNGATDPAQMYLSGDTVDLQLGTDPKADARRSEAVAGDLRLSIGNFQGKPTAVLYRAVSEEKKPRSFTSGVIARYQMDYVDVVPDARIQVAVRPDKKGYAVEAAIPWAALGFVPQQDAKYRGDLGATFGNEAGSRTRLRVYWSNQETGLVDDAVFELKMTPRNWGAFLFRK